MQLTAEQLRVVQGGEALRFTLPEVDTEFVLIRADLYERLQSLAARHDVDPESMYQLLADIAPEDWEDASAYNVSPRQP